MSSEPTPLVAAAQRKRHSAQQRASAAIAALDKDGMQVTFQSVAARAGVSRQWLYTNPELRVAIEKLRARHRSAQPIPAAQRASDASLRQRYISLQEDNKRLRRENAELKRECEQLLGERRADLQR